MEEMLYIGPFTIKVLLRSIVISKDNNSLTLEPPQLLTARDLILSVMRIESFTALPSQMGTAPFCVTFDENREISLTLNGVYENHIHFTFDDGDELITALQAAYQKWTDVTRAESGRATAPAPDRILPGATFDVIS